MADNIIRFQSYNPYEARFPGVKVVSRQTVEIIKALRANGYEVIVEPNDGSKLNYYTQKGFQEALSDPIIAIIVNTYISFVISLLANMVYDWLKEDTQENINLIIEFDENGNKVRYNYKGKMISDEQFKALLDVLSQKKKAYESSVNIPREGERPLPIYLEHTSEIVGWAEGVFTDNMGLKLKNAKITNENTRRRIQTGELQGLSVAGIVNNSTCTICSKEYVECNHIARKKYDGEICSVRIDKFLIAEFSIVKKPVNPLAKIKIIKNT